jgi:hypothetical protein
MPLKPQLDHELQRLAATGGGGRLACAVGQGKLTADVLAIDAIGCSVEQVTFETPQLATASVPQLMKLSAALTQKLTYLLEPISLIETDVDAATVQLRSKPPQSDDDGTQYYELLVRRGGSLTLVRFQKTSGQPRQIIPAHFTRQVLYRLCEDLVAAAP